MSNQTRWPCYLVLPVFHDPPIKDAAGDSRTVTFQMPDGRECFQEELRPGACFEGPRFPNSPESVGLWVLLPGNFFWNMRAKSSRGGDWAVTGTPPNVNAHPSINVEGLYHGWVQCGHVSDDVDGRRFDDMGRLIK